VDHQIVRMSYLIFYHGVELIYEIIPLRVYLYTESAVSPELPLSEHKAY
jgi:hypothetical protein